MGSIEGVERIAPAVRGISIEGPGAASPPFLSEPEPDEPRVELFDPSPYVIEGQSADTLTIAFAGSVSFDARDPQAQAMFAKLQLGASVSLNVNGAVVSKAGRWKISKDEEETVTGVAGVKIDTLYLPAPEDL